MKLYYRGIGYYLESYPNDGDTAEQNPELYKYKIENPFFEDKYIDGYTSKESVKGAVQNEINLFWGIIDLDKEELIRRLNRYIEAASDLDLCPALVIRSKMLEELEDMKNGQKG